MKKLLRKWLGIEEQQRQLDVTGQSLVKWQAEVAERIAKLTVDLTVAEQFLGVLSPVIESEIEKHRTDALGGPFTPEELAEEGERMDDELLAKGKAPRYGKRAELGSRQEAAQ